MKLYLRSNIRKKIINEASKFWNKRTTTIFISSRIIGDPYNN